MGAHGKGRFEILEMPIHGELVPMTAGRRVRRLIVLGWMRFAPLLRPVGKGVRRAVRWLVFGFLWAVCGGIDELLQVLIFVGGALLFGAGAVATLVFAGVLVGGLIAWAFHMASAVQPLIHWGARAVAGVFAVALAFWLLGSLARGLTAGVERLRTYFARRAGLPVATPAVVQAEPDPARRAAY